MRYMKFPTRHPGRGFGWCEMPIYEYKCQDCFATIEIFQQPGGMEPKRCGFRCPLNQGEHDDLRGMGALERILSAIGGNIRPSARRDRPTMDEAARAGFQFYENKGDGTLKRVAGDKGPEVLYSKKPGS